MRVRHPAHLSSDDRHAYRVELCGPNAQAFEHLDDGTLIVTGINHRHARVRYFLAVFAGKAVRPMPGAFGCFLNEEHRAEKIAEVKARLLERANEKAARRAEQRKPHTLLVGNILCASWGYDQTNVDFYEVVSVRGAVIDMREVATRRTHDTDMTGTAEPVPGKYIGALMRSKRPGASNGVRICSFIWARLWDGKPERWSSYA